MAVEEFDGALDAAPEIVEFTGSLDGESGEETKGRTWKEVAGDVGVSLLKGAIDLPASIVGLADIPTGGRVGKALESVGYRPSEASKIVDDWYSEPQKAANAKVRQAEGFGDTLMAAVENPSTIAATALESAPSMLGGAGIARGLMKVAPKIAPVVAGALGEGAISAGSAAGQVRHENESGLLTAKQSLSAVGSGAGTALLGFAGGKLAQKLGIADVDTLLASGQGQKVAKGFARQVVGAGVSEGVFEELPQSAQEQMWQNYATGRPILEGVGNASALGMLAGVSMGAVGGIGNAAVGAPKESDSATESIPADEVLGDSGALNAEVSPDPDESVQAEPVVPVDMGMQNRDRGTASSILQMQSIANAPDFDRLADSPIPDVGAPMVSIKDNIEGAIAPDDLGAGGEVTLPDGSKVGFTYAVVEADSVLASHDVSGRSNPAYAEPETGSLVALNNGRTAGLQEAYARGTATQPGGYLDQLMNNAERLGIAPEAIAAKQAPVLVRVYDDAVNARPDIARQANSGGSMGMSAQEVARNDAAILPDLSNLVIDEQGEFNPQANAPFVRGWVSSLPQNEQAEVTDRAGNLSQTGFTRLRNAVIAKAYGQSSVFGRLVESLDNDMRNVGKALVKAAPKIAKVKELIAAGAARDLDISEHINRAVADLVKLRQAGTSLADFLAQANLFQEHKTPGEVLEILAFLDDNLRAPNRIADFLSGYYAQVEALGDPGQGDMFGAPEVGRGELLRSAAAGALPVDNLLGVNDGRDGTGGTDSTGAGATGSVAADAAGFAGDQVAPEFSGADEPGGSLRQEPGSVAVRGEGLGPGVADPAATVADLAAPNVVDITGQDVPLDPPAPKTEVGKEARKLRERIKEKKQSVYADGAKLLFSAVRPFLDRYVYGREKGGSVPNPLFVVGNLTDNGIREIAKFIDGFSEKYATVRVSGQSLKHTDEQRHDLLAAVIDDLPRVVQSDPIEVLHNPSRKNSAFVVYRRSNEDGPNALIVVEIAKNGSGTDIVNVIATKDRQLKQYEKRSNAWLDGRLNQEGQAHHPVNSNVPAEGDFSDFQPSTSKTLPQDDGNVDTQSRPTGRDARQSRKSLDAKKGQSDVAQVDARGDQGSGDQRDGSAGDTSNRAGIEGGTGNDAEAPVPGDGTAAPVGDADAGDASLDAKASEKSADLPRADTVSAPVADTEQSQPILNPVGDFGEKLGGARKDIARNMADDLKREFSDEELASLPLAKIWPKTDIDAIENPFIAAFAYAARDEIPARPRTGYKLARWIGQVKTLRELTGWVMGLGESRVRELIREEHQGLARQFMPKVNLLAAVDRKAWSRIERVTEHPDAYRYGDNSQHIPAPYVAVNIDGKAQLFDGARYVADVVEKVNALLGNEAEAKKMQFEVRGHGASFLINKKGDSEYRKLKTFPTAKEALDFVKTGYDELVAAWDAVKQRDNVKETDVRNAGNRPRSAKDWRNGKDVSVEEFQEKFGFRGGEFGNWVSQGKGAKERQWMLNEAHDALMDLADILGIPPKAVSLNGTLGIAFGARGSGNASAHYEPGNVVINLTKTKGAGTLAHEWFHALDNYFSRLRGGESKVRAGALDAQDAYRQNNYITYKPEPLWINKTQASRAMTRTQLQRMHEQNPSSSYFNPENWKEDPAHPQGVRPEVERSFAELVEALDKSPMAARSRMNDKGANGYWGRIIERGARAFENYIIHKMMQEGYHNDYLANVRDVNDFPRSKARYPYLLPEEVEPVAAAFDQLFETVETRETERGTAMFSRTTQNVETIDVDGVERPTTNSNGQPIHPTEEGIRNFWRWYDGLQRERLDRAGQRGQGYEGSQSADSGISNRYFFDEQGRPRVLYHGTNADITAFDLDHPDKWDHGWLGRGIYLGSDPDLANFYAVQKGGQSNVMPLYAAVTNPYVFSAEEKKHLSRMTPEAVRAVTERAMDHGHDGGVLEFGDGSFELVAFKNTAVKSVSGNTGRFGTDTQDIRFARSFDDVLGTVHLTDLNAVADRFRKEFPAIPVVVLEKERLAPKSLRDDIRASGATGTVSGAFHNGSIYLIREGIRNVEHATFVAFHEGVHAGVQQMFGKAIEPIMLDIWERNLKVQVAAKKIKDNYRYSTVKSVEEVLADMGEGASKLKGWDRFIGFIRGKLRKIGLVKDWLDKDIEYLAFRALRSLRTGRTTSIYSGTSLSAAPAGLDATLRRTFYSRTDQGQAQPTLKEIDAKVAEILARPRKTPLGEAIVKGVAQAARIDRATVFVGGKVRQLLDQLVPESVKAGMVSDYGVPEAVTDRRDMMFGHMRRQLRETENTLARLATLTRQESRIAYEWMNNRNADHLLEQLPDESRKILTELKQAVTEMGQEAVRLGQLDADTFERHAMAYLHRSYRKWDLEAQTSEKRSRAKAIKVLGDQYKGRGMTDLPSMAAIKNLAPDWWNRKTQNGKADKQLRGEKFIRLERRANRGDGAGVLAGMGETGQLGKLLEVNYWPAGEPLPAKYGAWHQSGTWEVRDTKADKLVMWRDFTPDERTKMGEIDEVRFAVAKTLHKMIHDLEVGKYFEWLASTQGKPEDRLPTGAKVIEARDTLMATFGKDDWVQVPESTITGTHVKKYGKLAGLYIPGPLWNDIRQVANVRFNPLGETYAAILKAWKASKTALSPAVHLNNIMANFVMADWHDVTWRDTADALNVLIHQKDPANQRIIEMFEDAGGTQGMYVLSEIQREQLAPLVEQLRQEVGIADNEGQMGAFAALQSLMRLRFADAYEQMATTAAGRLSAAAVGKMMEIYNSEDTVFRLAAFMKAKREGASDAAAGRAARSSFLDYSINAPWVQMLRQTTFPFIAFTYRAVPMLLNTIEKKPWKLMKLALFLGGVNALGYALSGGDEDKERKLLPEEKAGGVLGGVAPKLIRMPWNHEMIDRGGNKTIAPVFLDIRRFITLGDIVDLGQTHSAVPLLPLAIPGGPLALLSELIANRSQFTGQDITKETDTGWEKAGKVFNHLYKAFAPNMVGIPGTYATQGVMNAGTGKTDAFGREQSLAMAGLSSIGVKLGAYPRDTALMSAGIGFGQAKREIQANIMAAGREYARKGISKEEYEARVRKELDKLQKRAVEYTEQVQ